MKIGFTGTRKGMSQHQKEQFVLKMFELDPSEFHHGDCEGADAEAHDIIREFFPLVKIICHPPKSNSQRAWKHCDDYMDPLPYLTRDYKIVDDVDYMFGAPLQDNEIIRSGTWTTIRYSRKKNKLLTILER
jgi:hypothetical protein